MKQRSGFFLLMIFLLTGLSFCSKEEPIPEDQVIGLPFFLITDDVNSFACERAYSGGQIIENEGLGGCGIFTSQGVCWSTAPNPTTADNQTLVDGIDLYPKHFHSTLTDLNPGTTYYVRAFATNSEGTAYGNEVSFTTPECIDQPCSDKDGNIYKTVQIGPQTWMAENLKTTKYNDGSLIFTGTGNPDSPWSANWFGSEEGAYCWYYFDTKYKDTYGAIYNWHAVGTGKLCPTGWHVPTYSDWTTLITSLGGEVGPFNEKTENAFMYCSENKINESGFAPVTHGELCGWGFLETDLWWSSTPRPAKNNYIPGAYVVALRIIAFEPPSYGYSVRCLKD